jgi:hypothetical protein
MGSLDALKTPDQKLLKTLKKFDDVISSARPSDTPKEERYLLPLPLAALGARIFAETRPQGVPEKLRKLPDSTVLYQFAAAFIYSRICTLKVGSLICRDTLANNTGLYRLPKGVSQEIWRQNIARCLGQCAKFGYLKKEKDSTYTTLQIT